MSRGWWSVVGAGLDLTQCAGSGGGATSIATWFATTVAAVGCWLTFSAFADRWMRGGSLPEFDR